MIEVEIRSFLTDEEYSKLLNFFKKNGNFLDEDFQITVYFSGDNDLRVQKTKNYSKLWLKTGKIHDVYREEIEVLFKREDFEKLVRILKILGFNAEIVWLRKRLKFEWDGIKVYLDDTKGYGKIIELELHTEKEERNSKEILLKRLKELGINLTPRETFEKKFLWYKKNWRHLIKESLKRFDIESVI